MSFKRVTEPKGYLSYISIMSFCAKTYFWCSAMAKNHGETSQNSRGLVNGSLVSEVWQSRGLVRRDLDGGLVNRGRRGRGLAETLDVLTTGNIEGDILKLNPYIDRLAKADPKNSQEITASQLQFMTGHYKIALSQSRRCFFWALVAAGIGALFFVVAAVYSIATGNAGPAIVLVLSGTVIEGIASILFRSSGHVAADAHDFHANLETMHRHLLANSISESLSGEMREELRGDLARKIANIHKTSFLTTPLKQSQGNGQS
jgi:hypothetical protein